MQISTIGTRAFYFMLFFFIAPASSAQDACGCKEGEQLRTPIGMYFNSGRLDSAEYYIQKFLTFKEKGCKINFNGAMAQVALAKKEYAGARTYLDTEEKLLKENGCDQEMYVRHYSTLAKLYQELNIFDSLTTACLKGIEASEKAGDYYGLSRANADLASAFAQLAQNDKAVFYYRNALQAALQQTKSPALPASVQTRLGNEYLTLLEKTGNTVYADSAALLANEALQTASKHHDMLAYLEANETLASHALVTKQYTAALKFAETIISNTPRGVHLLDRLIYNGFAKKSKALFELKDFTAAEKFADSALQYAQAFNAQMMVGAYERIYETAKANNNTGKSFSAYEKMTALKDSLFSLQKNTAITELEKKYNQAKNEKTIKELAQQKSIYLLLALAGLLGLGLLLFFIRQQSLKSKHKILETEQRLNRARINPHFFFNALGSLQAFAMEANDGKSVATNLSKFSHIMRETLESTYKDYITAEKETTFLTEYLELQNIRFPEKFTYAITADDLPDPEEALLPSMILQPFVENSIEHGFSGISYTGHIQISFQQKENSLHIIVADNGKGLPASPKENSEHISRASQIIKDRIYLLNIKLKTNASFSIANNKNENGVTVLINLPLLYKEDIKD